MKNIIFSILLAIITLYAKPMCEFPPALGVKNFSFETHGYTPPEYALQDDTFGLIDLDKFGNDATRNAIQSSNFPFEALNIIAGCGNSDAMYAASLVYDDKRIKEFWTKEAAKMHENVLIFKEGKSKQNDMKLEKKYNKLANTLPKMYKKIKLYWLKRAIKLGNIKAIVTYYMYIKKDEQKRHTLIAKALYKIYKTNKNKYLKDMAFSELYYNKEYQETLGIDLSSYKNVKYLTLHTKVFDTGHWRNYGDIYEVDTSKDDLEFFKNESKVGVPEASLELADYYSWRDYKKTLKYLDLYKKQEHRLSSKLYLQKAKYYDKQNKTNAYMYSKDTLIYMIWNDLDKYQKAYSKNLDKNIKAENKKIKEVKKPIVFYKNESKELFDIDIQQLAKLQKDKKLKLIQDKATNISKEDEKFIFEVMHHIAQWKKGKKAFVKSRNKREKKVKELYTQLSNRSKHIVIDIAKELIRTNPKSYTTKSKDKHFKIKETMTRVQYLVLNLLEIMVKIENNEYDRPTIVKKVKKFNKPKYGIKYTQNVMLLARKIDTLAFSNSNTFSLTFQNKYKLFKENKSKIQKAIVYWLNYTIKNKKNFSEKYVNEACYRLAQAYDERLPQRLNGIKLDKEKVFEMLSEIKDHENPSFSRYLIENYPSQNIDDMKLFLNKAVVYSHKNNKTKYWYFKIFEFEKWKNYNEIEYLYKSKNWYEMPSSNRDFNKEERNKVKKFYNIKEYTALTYYQKYFASIVLRDDKENKFRNKAMKLNYFAFLSYFIHTNFYKLIVYTDEDFDDNFIKNSNEMDSIKLLMPIMIDLRKIVCKKD